MQIGSYPKVYQLGHREIAGILDDEVVVEEKVDGSQFSFGVFDGQLACRSHRKMLDTDAPESMFAGAVETVKRLAPMLRDGWTYRGEVLSKPKHNTLAYDRTPAGNIILFDVMTDRPEWYLDRDEKNAEAERLGLEIVPELFRGRVESPAQLLAMLDRVSCLGGQRIEGVVVKNNKRFSADGKPMFGKYVSESFKEVHRIDYKGRHPNRADIVDRIIEAHCTPARWEKAVQHLAEEGTLKGEPQDIGQLMREAARDVSAECASDIKEVLWEHFRSQILKGVTNGLPEWYKRRLAGVEGSP